MTEAQWLAGDDPVMMLKFAARKASPRKLRLFAVACCRRLFGDRIEDDRTRATLAVAERYADDRATKEDLVRARQPAGAAREHSWRAARAAWWTTYGRAPAAARGVLTQAVPPPWQSNAVRAPRARPAPLSHPTLRSACSLLRELFNPFCRVQPDPTWLAWNEGTAAFLARAIDAEGRFADLPVLADALEEAGCQDASLLNHLRTGDHVRGCWALDLLIGKK